MPHARLCFLKKINLFLSGSGLSCGTQDLHCSELASLSSLQAGLVAPQHVRVFIPQPGTEPTCPALAGRVILIVLFFFLWASQCAFLSNMVYTYTHTHTHLADL